VLLSPLFSFMRSNPQESELLGVMMSIDMNTKPAQSAAMCFPTFQEVSGSSTIMMYALYEATVGKGSKFMVLESGGQHCAFSLSAPGM
jgi:hypothetical protein